ncbi:MAG: S-layer homology domain-containing protein, partial [Halanaerobiales bacterium]
MKKYSILIAMVLVLALSVTTFAGSFADVPSNHWAYEGVNKLVAAGLIQGYPDGTFKGQNDLTRYEIAVMLARLLEDIEEARAELVDQVDFMVNDALIEADSGLSPEEAEDVQAIVEAVIEKNDDGSDEPAEAPVQDELSSGQAGEVMTLIGNLAAEFAPELEALGVEVADLQERVDDLEVVTF